MQFTKQSVSKYGTAYYTREGFKQSVSIPSSHFEGGVAPETVEIGGEGITFAVKAAKVQATGIAKALKGVDAETRKKVREAGRKAEKDALAAAGVSL